ncbi:MAG: winged helix-turn-helix domain-containing protein [Proteobacteria bacterium]|nr:winged helix-turn-helix domain-containing protein [Pseudomonadota bacterium]
MPPTFDELQKGFELGEWRVDPERDLLINGGAEEHLEPMVMNVLVVLACAQGRVVTKQQLVDAVWGGRPTADDAIATKIAVLRNKLGDDRRNPVYIETIQKRGYRLRMAVVVPGDKVLDNRDAAPPRKIIIGVATAVAAIVAAAIVWWPRAEPIDSVAVLQFRNLCADKPACQHLVYGFSEELVVSLSQVPNLEFARGPEDSGNHSYKEIARQLGVDIIVTGSLRSTASTVLITADVIAKNGFQLKTFKYSGAAKDIFVLQERVADEILKIILGEEEPTVHMARRPPDSEAYDKYMRGLFFLDKRDFASLERAQALFQETIEIDSQFGPAYLRQAITLLLLSEYLPAQRGDNYENAQELAREGAKSDSSISDAIQLVHGFVYHQKGEWSKARDAFKAAFRGATVYPTAYHWHSRLLGDIGFMENSLQQALAAVALEPGSQILNSRVAISYLWNNDNPNARHYFDIAESMEVEVPDHYFAYTVFLIRNGRHEEARESVRKGLRLALLDDMWVDAVIDGLAYPDDPQRLAAAISTIDSLSADKLLPAYVTMTLWALYADLIDDSGDRIMEIALREAAEEGHIYELEIIFVDEFRELREHDQFPQLLQALGLSDYWSSIGCRWHEDQVLCDAT